MANKYRAKKAYRLINGENVEFDSIAEAEYFDYLYVLLRSKKIKDLKLQPVFKIFDGYKIRCSKVKSGISKIGDMKYTPDFSYTEDGKLIIVEVKGKITTDYTMRKKLFMAIGYRDYRVNTFKEVILGKETIYQLDSLQSTTK